MLIAFLWLTSTALKGAGENILPILQFLFLKISLLKTFKMVLILVPIVGYALNSFIVASFTVVLNLIFSALAAYPLARMNFKGKNIIFLEF